MDVRYINPFMKAISHVFKTMLNLEVSFGKPQVKVDEKVSHDVSSIIGLSGDVAGVVIMSYPRPSAFKIAGIFAGMSFNELNEDLADPIGELANMVAGNAKKDIEGLNISISIPSVVIGHGHQISSTKMVPRLVIPCSTPAGSFVVEVGLKVLKKTVDSKKGQGDSAKPVEKETAVVSS